MAPKVMPPTLPVSVGDRVRIANDYAVEHLRGEIGRVERIDQNGPGSVYVIFDNAVRSGAVLIRGVSCFVASLAGHRIEELDEPGPRQLTEEQMSQPLPDALPAELSGPRHPRYRGSLYPGAILRPRSQSLFAALGCGVVCGMW